MALRLTDTTDDQVGSKGGSGSRIEYNGSTVTVSGWFKIRSRTGLIGGIDQGSFGLWEIGAPKGTESGTAVTLVSGGGGNARIMFSVYSTSPGVAVSHTVKFQPVLFDRWIHLAISSTSILHRFYLNGVEVGVKAGLTRTASASSLWINRTTLPQHVPPSGDLSTNPGLKVGWVDVSRFAIWRRILDERQILSLFNGAPPNTVSSGSSGGLSDLAAWWEFDSAGSPHRDLASGLNLVERGAPTTIDSSSKLARSSGQRIFKMNAPPVFDPSTGDAALLMPINQPPMPTGEVGAVSV